MNKITKSHPTQATENSRNKWQKAATNLHRRPPVKQQHVNTEKEREDYRKCGAIQFNIPSALNSDLEVSISPTEDEIPEPSKKKRDMKKTPRQPFEKERPLEQESER